MIRGSSRTHDTCLIGPEYIHIELLAEGASLDKQLFLLHAQRLHRHIPILANVNHVENH